MDQRRLEVVVDGLPLFHGVQVAIDTMVSPVRGMVSRFHRNKSREAKGKFPTVLIAHDNRVPRKCMCAYQDSEQWCTLPQTISLTLTSTGLAFVSKSVEPSVTTKRCFGSSDQVGSGTGSVKGCSHDQANFSQRLAPRFHKHVAVVMCLGMR